MAEITSILKKKITQLAGEIERLQSQKAALETAVDAIEGASARTRPRQVRARVARRATRGPVRRRKRGANQKLVLAALSREPRRLTAIAAKARLGMSGAASTLRIW